MHIMHSNQVELCAVSFELNGRVEAPHEILGDAGRWARLDSDRDVSAFWGRWLGVRGALWGELPLFLESPGTPRYEIQTLIYLAKKVPNNLYKAPDMDGVGLTDSDLHRAVKMAVTAQAAYRALADWQSIARLPAPGGTKHGQQGKQE